MWHADVLRRLSHLFQLKTFQCWKMWNLQGIVTSFGWETFINEAVSLHIIIPSFWRQWPHYWTRILKPLFIFSHLCHLAVAPSLWMAFLPCIFLSLSQAWFLTIQQCFRFKPVEKFSNLLQASPADLSPSTEPGNLIPKQTNYKLTVDEAFLRQFLEGQLRPTNISLYVRHQELMSS